MKTTRTTILITIAALALFTSAAFSHCDTLNGPVAIAAREALESGHFEEIQIWVGQEQEKELRERFEQSRQVRQTGGAAQELADRYFIETAVRLHREAEGMSYTGLQPAGPMPEDIAAAEKALEQEDVSAVTDLLTEEIQTQTRKWYDQAIEARSQKDESVAAGRRWVDAYVRYVVYVHGLHQKLMAGPEHGIDE